MAEDEEYPDAVRRRAERMRRARRRQTLAWRSLAQVGALGFMFVLPLLLLTALGRWLEHHEGWPGAGVGGVLLGLLVGGLLAWREIRRGLADEPGGDEP
jgi:predicted F0F1-ATPase subunit